MSLNSVNTNEYKGKLTAYIRALGLSREHTNTMTNRVVWSGWVLKDLLRFISDNSKSSFGRPTLNEWKRSEGYKGLSNKPFDELLLAPLFTEVLNRVTVCSSEAVPSIAINGISMLEHLQQLDTLLQHLPMKNHGK